MSATLRAKWQWERIVPSRNSASGDFSKMFKNESVKAPGVFAEGAPAPEAALLVREVIQNSWDAALESRKSSSADGITPFEVRFRFVSESGDRRDALVEYLGLRELADRAAAVDNRDSLGLRDIDCLDE